MLVVAALSGGAERAAAATPTPSPAPGSVVVDRTVRDRRISEDSALVASRRHAGILWTLNDSGHPPQLFAVGPSGATAATLRVGATNTDWEALAPATGPGGRPVLLVGDIGDNAAVRPAVQVLVVPEPERLRDARVAPLRTLRLTYPDGPRDAEALFVDPLTSRMYLVSKGFLGGTLYAVPASAWPGNASTATLEPVGTVGLGLVTDAAALPDGQVLLRTYGTLALMPAPTAVADGVWRPAAQAQLPEQQQGEGLAVDAGAAAPVLLSSEGASQPVLRWRPGGDLGAALARALRGPSSSSASSSSASSSSSEPGRPTDRSGSDPATSGTSASAPRTPGTDVAWRVGQVVTGVLVVAALALFFRARMRHHRR